jgi:hypothetical protein
MLHVRAQRRDLNTIGLGQFDTITKSLAQLVIFAFDLLYMCVFNHNM